MSFNSNHNSNDSKRPAFTAFTGVHQIRKNKDPNNPFLASNNSSGGGGSSNSHSAFPGHDINGRFSNKSPAAHANNSRRRDHVASYATRPTNATTQHKKRGAAAAFTTSSTKKKTKASTVAPKKMTKLHDFTEAQANLYERGVAVLIAFHQGIAATAYGPIQKWNKISQLFNRFQKAEYDMKFNNNDGKMLAFIDERDDMSQCSGMEID